MRFDLSQAKADLAKLPQRERPSLRPLPFVKAEIPQKKNKWFPKSTLLELDYKSAQSFPSADGTLIKYIFTIGATHTMYVDKVKITIDKFNHSVILPITPASLANGDKLTLTYTLTLKDVLNV